MLNLLVCIVAIISDTIGTSTQWKMVLLNRVLEVVTPADHQAQRKDQLPIHVYYRLDLNGWWMVKPRVWQRDALVGGVHDVDGNWTALRDVLALAVESAVLCIGPDFWQWLSW